ncbi:MAG: ComF family protein [Candidatus Margulisiibacteriota bacterium]
MPFHDYISAFLDLIFPPRCAVCKNVSSLMFCDSCLSKVKYLDSQRGCVYCGLPKDPKFGRKVLLCKDCTRARPHFDLARSLTIYEGVIRRAIHQFKFSNKKMLAEPLGKIIKSRLTAAFPEIINCGAEVTIAVPLSDRRRSSRGFNQAEVLAKCAAECLGIPYQNEIITRSRETLPQFDLPKEKRSTNVSGAFRINNPKAIQDQRILLVDDIYTTGATVNECAKTLKQGGAAKVYVLTLARAVLD